MLHIMAKYRVLWVLAGMILALGGVVQAAVSAGAITVIVLPPGANQQNNQMLHGASFFNNHATLIGSRQANTGNNGLNRGFSQDNSSNAGNQVIAQHKPI